MRCLYILEINPLLVASLANIFSHSLGFLCLVYGFLCCAETLKSNQVPLFIFISLLQEVDLKRCHCHSCQRVFCLCFSLRVLPGLTFRTLIHFQFIFVYGVIECSNFILLHVAVQFPQHHFLKRFSFLHYIVLPPLSQIS